MKIPSRILLGALCGIMAFQLGATDREIDVVVTPTMLVRDNSATALLTVHANVPLAEVIRDSARLVVILSPQTQMILEPLKVFADASGDLVAKFDAAAVKTAVTPRSNKVQQITLVFTVTKADESVFFGTDTVRVK